MEVDGFTFFGEAGDGGGYDWSVFGVWLKKDTGQFFWAADAGCSCTSPWDSLTPADFSGPGNPHDVIKALFEWAGTYNHSACETMLNKLLEYRSA